MTPPGLYRHFKGNLYLVLHTVEKATEDQTGTAVVYVSLTNGKLFVRDEWDFNALIDPETMKAFEGGPSMWGAARSRLIPRFTYQGVSSTAATIGRELREAVPTRERSTESAFADGEYDR